jgi:thymidylate kinase
VSTARHLRAAENPFRVGRVEALRYRAPGFDWQDLLARLERQKGRGALRGPEGTGKTTLLLELGDRLRAQGYAVRHLRPDLDDRRLARRQVREFAHGVDRRTALLLDGADRVGKVAWWRLRWAARRAAVLVVTTHREGRLPTLQRCRTSPELLAELVGELVPHEAIGMAAADLWEGSEGNVRRALRTLYDRASRGANWLDAGADLPRAGA